MSDAEPEFHPLDAYSMDELFDALDRRCHGVFIAALPRKVVGEGPTTVDFIRWHDYHSLTLLGAVERYKRHFIQEIDDLATPEDPAPDDV